MLIITYKMVDIIVVQATAVHPAVHLAGTVSLLSELVLFGVHVACISCATCA